MTRSTTRVALGAKIKYISVDDEYNPAKSVEQARKLVERDQVLLLFLPLGTAHNAAIQKYMNTRRCLSFSSDPGVLDGEIPRHFRGRWAGSRPTKPKAKLTQSTF